MTGRSTGLDAPPSRSGLAGIQLTGPVETLRGIGGPYR